MKVMAFRLGEGVSMTSLATSSGRQYCRFRIALASKVFTGNFCTPPAGVCTRIFGSGPYW
jgi:hypothetical protein